jgi:hypothetical protein
MQVKTVPAMKNNNVARHHIVISGTGRAGTTFLVELLTHLGLDTGFKPEDLALRKNEVARAGLEHDIRNRRSPYVVKTPHFCDIAEEILTAGDIVIDRVIIPMRDVYAAAESRRCVRAASRARESLLKRMAKTLRPRRDPGGLWHTAKGHEQEIILLQQLYKLTLALSRTAIPVTFLRFPTLVNDPSYLFMKLKPMLGDISIDQFMTAFETTANPQLVHRFSAEDC